MGPAFVNPQEYYVLFFLNVNTQPILCIGQGGVSVQFVYSICYRWVKNRCVVWYHVLLTDVLKIKY
jgi:hypothetical protein